jgi:hypothetical protein
MAFREAMGNAWERIAAMRLSVARMERSEIRDTTTNQPPRIALRDWARIILRAGPVEIPSQPVTENVQKILYRT